MTTRWWAPDGAHIGPDERDFELLIPVDDARHDLGAALLALHRVGAAACEEVALHAIPDEISLVQALATARQAFAAPLVESVSKSVGEGPYAGLLVRDTIDDAESAALLVFRTLTSSGVPAQLAAQRAGMVYGVPEDSLSTYLTVAKELRAHPAALADAADRALFGAIEKIATEEFEAKPELVQKATPNDPQVETEESLVIREPDSLVVRDDPSTPYYDGRDAAGRFARGSVTGPPAVGEPPARVRRTRPKRPTRATRPTRARRPEPTGRLVPTRDTQRAVGRTASRPMGRDVARLKRSRDEMTEAEKNRLISLDPVTWSDGDFLAKLEHPKTRGPFSQIEHELAIGLSTDEWAELQAHLGRDEQGRLAFRMGHIAQEGRDANVFGRTSDFETDAHRQVLKKLATDALGAVEEQYAGVDVHLPIAVTIDDDEVDTKDPAQVPEYIEGKKRAAIAKWLAEQGADTATPESQRYIDDALSMMRSSTRAPDNRGAVYHYIPRVSGNAVAPRISVVELVFEPGTLGRDEGHGKHANYVFDPNQVMRVENGRPAVIYDPQIQAFRLRYFITPLVGDDDSRLPGSIDKAYDPNEPRDRGGRWTAAQDTEESLVVREPESLVLRDEEQAPTRSSKPKRRTRATRATRSVRPTRIQAQPVGRTFERSTSRKVSRPVRRDIQRQLVEIEQQQRAHTHPSLTSYRELFLNGDYRVLTRHEMDTIEDQSEMRPGDDGVYVHLSDHKTLLAGNKLDGRMADFTMRELTDHNIMGMDDEQGIAGAYIELAGPDQPLDPTDSDFPYQVHDHMDRLFARHDWLEQVQVFYDLEGNVSFLGNKYRADPVVLVQVSDDFDPDRPFRLEPDTSIRYDELIPNFDEPMESVRQAMSSLHYDENDAQKDRVLPLKITRPKIDLYRLENETSEPDDEIIHFQNVQGRKGHYRRPTIGDAYRGHDD